MDLQIASQTGTEIQCVNKSIADDFIRRYQSSTKNALENILCMGEAVNEIYQKTKSGELDKSDLEYFCQSVHLDPKSSTFRKYKAIGENSSRFREILEKLPPTFSVLYEMATLSSDDFENFTKNTVLSKSTTLEEFKQLVRKAQVKSPALIPQSTNSRPVQRVKQVDVKENYFEFTASPDIQKWQLDEIVNTLNYYSEKKWIQFEKPQILTSIDSTQSQD